MVKKILSIIFVILLLGIGMLYFFENDVIPKDIVILVNGIDNLNIAMAILAIILVVLVIIVNIKRGDANDKRRNMRLDRNNVSENAIIPPQKSSVQINNEDIDVSPSVNRKELELKRESLVQELKEAERQFLRHKLEKTAFDNISSEKNSKLIEIEAALDNKKKVGMDIRDARAMDDISIDKKKILKDLFDQKQIKVHELQLCEKSYLKRKIDENTYQKISADVKEEIISIEGKIKAIQKSNEVANLEAQLKEGAKEVITQQKSSEKRKKEQPRTFEDDVFEQMGV